MIQYFTKIHHAAMISALLLVGIPMLSSASEDIVSDDLITGSSQTTPWLVCDEDTPTSVATLDAAGCAYRTTPAEPGITYRMSCGVSVSKYASITLAFLDAADNELDKKITEVFEHTSGAYSVTLEAPAGTTQAAIGIYGEPGSGFQDCVLIDATPTPEPTKGSVSGVAWFDENGDSILDPAEWAIPGTSVTLYQNGSVVAQTQTDSDGGYYFGHLEVDVCYVVGFAATDTTLELGFSGGDNDALDSGMTADICLTETSPDVTDVDAAFVAIPPVEPPADYVMCGRAWADLNSNGTLDGDDTTFPNVTVKLFDADTDTQIAMAETSDPKGQYSFNQLPAGNYYVMFSTPDGYEPTTAAATSTRFASIISAEGNTGVISLPADRNRPDTAACTVVWVNAGYVQLPIALAPTIAKDDKVSFDEGVDFTIDALANDMPCDDSVVEVDLLGHNVPGMVSFNAATRMFEVSDTTDFGTYSIEYGIRGACGSYDTATITVELLEVVPPPPPAAPDAPECRAETGGNARNGGVDVFNPDMNGFADSYNFFDRDRNLLATVDSSDFTHKVFIGNDTSPWREAYIGNFEIEWNGRDYGFDQVAVFFASAIVNGVESALADCVRTLVSPIAIDLGNHGRIQRIIGDFSVDMDRDGIEEPLGQWFAPTAGILVKADAKGKISGEQLFGNVPGLYADGYEALSPLDKNGDSQLSDAELEGLAIWTDLNSDTIVDSGELTSLADQQIVSLSLTHYKYMSRATKADGKSVLVEDVWLPLTPLAAR